MNAKPSTTKQPGEHRLAGRSAAAHNRRMRRVYRFWAPVYDTLIRLPLYRRGREAAHRALALKPGERVLLVGIGTGADLPLLPADVQAVGVDLSRPMLARIKRRAVATEVLLLEADAANLPLAPDSFDAVLCVLILSVAGDPRRCLQEAVRVLKPGGTVVIFDKFAPRDGRLSLLRRAANLLTRAFGTDINRDWQSIAVGSEAELVSDEPLGKESSFRVIVMRKPPARSR